ncbi:molybdopterin biosynthesis protein MoeA [Desulfocucumis palustris]|uniref:Molybdopterin molybdenumtransferase n=1 Tax=Desulfocucumis palustris TaxID=1898651 RepID=A0A2L2XDU7_9FIRM|nr:gephyrin-like molybdotransferase Glp [Desulfocucumis palustris]GBF34539.1 molybdopterin biosynthesis protein MoeA [Desulfocucumis palustris]
MAELFKAITVAQAREMIGRNLNLQPPVKRVSITEALGKRVAGDITAEEDVPGFDRSTMDGFAVMARDTFGAMESLPAYLDVDGEIFMGKEASLAIVGGRTWRVPTGGMLPPGADAVVMVEHTEELDGRTIGVTRPVAPGENIVRRGEDVSTGSVVLARGHSIRPQDMGFLAAAGVHSLEVEEPLRVTIISTGDEVVPPERSPGPGQVRDVNSYTLYGMAGQCGAYPVIAGIIKDDFQTLKEAMEKALTGSDMVLLSGGSSVGTRDVSSRVIESLGRPGVLFHGISIKPGKPTIGAVVDGKPVFGLPGHPVSAMVVFALLVEPLLKTGRYPQNEREKRLEFPLPAKINRNVRSAAGREDFLRVELKMEQGVMVAEPVLGKSGLIGTMVRAEGLARIPIEKEGVEAGEYVLVRPF